jgi:hypothetical protein
MVSFRSVAQPALWNGLAVFCSNILDFLEATHGVAL